jgi:hypothetical protein
VKRKPLLVFAKWYLTIKPWEKSSRIYERLGIPGIDRVLSKLFGEEVMPAYEPGAIMSKPLLLTKMFRGQYNEVVNFICVLIFLALALLSWWSGVMWLVWLSVILMQHHLIVLPIERWKRILAQEWRSHPEALDPDGEIPMPPIRPKSEVTTKPWAPLKFESENFYEKIWIKSYRIYVFWLLGLADTIADDEMREYTPHVMRNTNTQTLDAFERQTRTSETVHWIGILENLPYLGVWLWMSFWPGVIGILGVVYLNLYAIFLQRQHRARIWSVLLKKIDRHEAKL